MLRWAVVMDVEEKSQDGSERGGPNKKSGRELISKPGGSLHYHHQL